MGTLILVRHGESEGNRDQRFTSSPAVALTELGRKQAQGAALKIRQHFKPRLVISSPYARALQTARIIAAELALSMEIDPSLREKSLGVYAGQPYAAMEADPTFSRERHWLWKPPEGESLAEVLRRVGPAFDAIASRHREGEVVVVSHGGVMAAAWRHITGCWREAWVPNNAAIIVVRHAEGVYEAPTLFSE